MLIWEQTFAIVQHNVVPVMRVWSKLVSTLANSLADRIRTYEMRQHGINHGS
jgi:hypothetical protein